MEILQRLLWARINAFDTVLIYTPHFWYATNTLLTLAPHLISIAKCYLNCLLS